MQERLDGAVRDLEVLQRAPHVAHAEVEELTGTTVHQADRPGGVDDELRHRRLLEGALTEANEVGERGRRLVVHARALDEGASARRNLLLDPAEDARGEIERREEVGVSEEHLGLAEEEDPPLAEREVEAEEDAALRLRVQVHDRVAAREQIDARDGRVVDQIVATEDHAAAHVAAELEPAGGGLEVPGQEGRRHGLHVGLRVARPARLLKGLLVEVRRVDLHALAGRVRTEQLAEDHGQRVCLLARGAPGAPDTDRCVGAARGDERREHLGTQVVPRLGVAEERRDVDQDGVEEERELLGVDLEVIDVLRIMVDCDHLMRFVMRRARLERL
jgi:hypothetical protein